MMKEERIHMMDRVTTGLPAGVTERFHLVVGETRREQIVTAYAASGTPHAEYPAELPFIADTPSYVTIHPNGEIPPGARWLIAGEAGVTAMSHVIAHAHANGWKDAADDDAQVVMINQATQNRPGIRTHYLRKDNILRAIVGVTVDGQTILQMLDSPDA
jgi:hypothetical protein